MNEFQWIEIVLSIVLGIITYVASKERVLYPLHMLQLEGYDNEEYKKWLEKNLDKVKKFTYVRGEEKTPLVMTDRAKRLYKTSKVMTFLLVLCLLIFRIVLGSVALWPSLVVLVGFLGLYYFQYKLVARANAWNLPTEKKINDGFYFQAQGKIKKLREENGLAVVGITGSFGKTSTKFISNTILSESFRVQNTPSSYNTPMGLSKVINNDLNEEKQIFLAELGAKVPGEIKEVADLVQPTIGVITAIGPTHMHLFKTIETIQKTKYELIESLDENGVAIFNYDNDYVKPLADKTRIKTIRYGMEDVDKLDIYAKDIKVGERGSTFTLVVKDQGQVEAKTKLLGAHNISNLLAAASIGVTLGMPLDKIASGIEKVEPVEHRLNIVDGGTGVIVIDDAFNSNPVGAQAALDVLGAFENGKKIIITPGMVELGDMEEEENYKFGKNMAKVVDYAILVGPKRTQPIYKGLIEAGFSQDKIIVAKSLNEATASLGALTGPGDVVLFENDLPDTYNED